MDSGLVYYVIDTETTGLNPKFKHEICEYSIIRCTDKTQLTRQVRVDNPLNASADALIITGKTLQDLYKGVSKREAINDFHEFIEQDKLTPAHRCLIAHNSNFDKKFLHHMWTQYNKEFPADLWLDTIPLSKRLAAQIGQPKAKVKLDAALDLFGIKKLGGAHTAKGDARNTYLLWKHLINSNIEYIDLIKQLPHRKIEEPLDAELSDFE